jgi:transposase-like protein
LYFRLTLSLRLVREMLLERGIVVSYEAIRRWARRLLGLEFFRPRRAERHNSPTAEHKSDERDDMHDGQGADAAVDEQNGLGAQ